MIIFAAGTEYVFQPADEFQKPNLSVRNAQIEALNAVAMPGI